MSLQSPTIEPFETVSDPHRAPAAKPAVAPRSSAQHAPPEKRGLRAKFPRGIDPWTLGWMVGMHIAAVAALWYFSWTAFAIFLVLLWVSASLGVCLGYHRLLTHKGLILPRPLHYFFTMCGILSAEEMRPVEKVLSAAALTYVAATLTAILTLMYYVMRFAGSRN